MIVFCSKTTGGTRGGLERPVYLSKGSFTNSVIKKSHACDKVCSRYGPKKLKFSQKSKKTMLFSANTFKGMYSQFCILYSQFSFSPTNSQISLLEGIPHRLRNTAFNDLDIRFAIFRFLLYFHSSDERISLFSNKSTPKIPSQENSSLKIY